MSVPRILIIAGISGAGKSTVLRALSDFGFYTIDNLPAALFEEFLALTQRSSSRFGNAAILLNISSLDSGIPFLSTLNTLQGVKIELLFLDAKTEVVLKRYSETRRPHPSFNAEKHQTLADTIQAERNLLQSFRERANLIIDTSEMTVHDLRREILRFADTSFNLQQRMRVNFLSFGFKYGAPLDCDLLVDVRFIPNPFFNQALRNKSGADLEVKKFVLDAPHTNEFIERYRGLLNFLLPNYAFEGKAYLNVGVGCTGGKHRSVVIAEELANSIDRTRFHVSVGHRDIQKE